jgi:hypothetical protein
MKGLFWDMTMRDKQELSLERESTVQRRDITLKILILNI